jgi:hypothetical protein
MSHKISVTISSTCSEYLTKMQDVCARGQRHRSCGQRQLLPWAAPAAPADAIEVV